MTNPVPGGAAGPATGGSSAAPAKETLTRRGTELVMLAFAAALVTAAFMLVEANQEQALTFRIVWYGLPYLAMFTVAHLAVRRWAPYADPLILPCIALLNGLGLVMIYRIDLAELEQDPDWSIAAPKQVLWTAIA